MRIRGEELHIIEEGHNPLDREAPEVHLRPLVIPIIFGVMLLTCCFTTPRYMFTTYAVPALNPTATWTPEPTIPPTATATMTPVATYTPSPTYTPQPTVVVLPSTTPAPTVDRHVALPTPRPANRTYIASEETIDRDFSKWTRNAEEKVNQVIDVVPTIKPLNALTASATAPVMALQPITVTATPIPSPTAFWLAWHVVNMDVRVDPSRDGSSVVRNILLDAHGNVTQTLDIKCRMSNHSQDLRVNEPWSQKTIIEQGVPAYTFYINQPSTWDVQFYRYKTEKHAIDISELLKLPVNRNQIIEIYWQYGETPLIDAAHVNPGPGLDNGRTAPVSTGGGGGGSGETQIVKQTVIVVVTATPSVPPTQTPWIIRTNATATPYPTMTPRATNTAPVLNMPPTFTPPAHFHTPPPPGVTPAVLAPVSDSVAPHAARYIVYLPVVLKY